MEKELQSELWALIARIEQDAYQRGQSAAKAQLRALLAEDGSNAKPSGALVTQHPLGSTACGDAQETDTGERQRAPKGAARALVLRAMSAGDIEPSDAIEAAETAEERMVSVSTVRAELRRGKDEGRYDMRGGRWFLVKNEEGAGSPREGTPAPFQSEALEGR